MIVEKRRVEYQLTAVESRADVRVRRAKYPLSLHVSSLASSHRHPALHPSPRTLAPSLLILLMPPKRSSRPNAAANPPKPAPTSLAAAKVEIQRMSEAAIIEKRRVEYHLQAVEDKADVRIKRAEAQVEAAQQEASEYRAERDVYSGRSDWLETYKAALEQVSRISLDALSSRAK